MSTQQAPTESVDEGYKVFVGNLPFEANDADLAEYFGSAGKIVSANVITRGRRSLGYGFVNFESEAGANSAFNLLNKKEFKGREINVELAKPRDPNEPRPHRGFRGGRGRPRFGSYPREEFEFRPPNYGEGYMVYYPRGGFRGGRLGRGERRPERPVGPESTTTLFIANLPYSLTDEGLRNLFNVYTVTKARVVTLRSGRSKGFGFVEFADQGEQLRALKDMSEAVIDDRKLTVRIANDLPEEESIAA